MHGLAQSPQPPHPLVSRRSAGPAPPASRPANKDVLSPLPSRLRGRGWGWSCEVAPEARASDPPPKPIGWMAGPRMGRGWVHLKTSGLER